MVETFNRKSDQVPPNGGYGWAIVIAYAIFYGILYSMGGIFGVMYQYKITELKLSAKEVSTMLSAGFACGTSIGFVSAPLINIFGCRKVALLAAVFHISGKVLTAYARNYVEFFISYSIIESMAFGIGSPAYFVALTAYFDKKRSKAISISIGLTEIASIVYPPLVTLLQNYYGPHTTVLLVAAISLHTIFSALLLQPVKWHLKNAKIIIGHHDDVVAVAAMHPETIPFQVKDIVKLNLVDNEKFVAATTADEYLSVKTASGNNSNGFENRHKNYVKVLIVKIINFFDLTLLLDKTFLNTAIGVSFVDFAEFTYLTITPLILQDKFYTNSMIATILSSMAIADIILRFSSPYIAQYFRQTPRLMFLYSVLFFIVTRTAIYHATTFSCVLIAAIVNGIAKGIVNVYRVVVISSSVPIERLASANGIILITDGVLLMTIGPVIGYLRDTTGTYGLSILTLNCFSGLFLCLWITEIIWKRKVI